MIYCRAHFAFMIPTVHISIYNKINTSRFIHTGNFDIILIPVIPRIDPLCPKETEYLYNLIIYTVKAPEFSLLYKRDHISGLTYSIFNIFVTYAKLDLIIICNKPVFPTENLI